MRQSDYKSVYRFVFAGFTVNKSMLNISKASGCLLIGRSNCPSMFYCQIYPKCIIGVRVFLNLSIDLF